MRKKNLFIIHYIFLSLLCFIAGIFMIFLFKPIFPFWFAVISSFLASGWAGAFAFVIFLDEQ